ncbi:MAG: KH domain-containing protein [Patescibacteria group bacterium]|nr:KH domain-containing protein [Patescibacteria group bacterium]
MSETAGYLGMVLRGIVSMPDSISIEETHDTMGVFLRVWVDQADMSLVIGRGGEHVSAIKLLTKLSGRKHGEHVNVKFEEPV